MVLFDPFFDSILEIVVVALVGIPRCCAASINLPHSAHFRNLFPDKTDLWKYFYNISSSGPRRKISDQWRTFLCGHFLAIIRGTI